MYVFIYSWERELCIRTVCCNPSYFVPCLAIRERSHFVRNLHCHWLLCIRSAAHLFLVSSLSESIKALLRAPAKLGGSSTVGFFVKIHWQYSVSLTTNFFVLFSKLWAVNNKKLLQSTDSWGQKPKEKWGGQKFVWLGWYTTHANAAPPFPPLPPQSQAS
jgi:hypothetical protein